MEERTMHITTSSGFVYDIDKDSMDDMEILDDTMLMQDPEAGAQKKMAASHRVFRKVIGAETDARLRSFLKERDGRTKVSEYNREVFEVFRGLNESKKK